MNTVKQAWSPSLNVWEMKMWCFVETYLYVWVVCLVLLLSLFCSGFVLKLLRLVCGQGTQSQLQECGVTTHIRLPSWSWRSRKQSRYGETWFEMYCLPNLENATLEVWFHHHEAAVQLLLSLDRPPNFYSKWRKILSSAVQPLLVFKAQPV